MLINCGTYANQTPQIESRRRKTHANHWIFNLQGIFYFCILVQYSLILAQYLTPAKRRRDGGWRLHSTLRGLQTSFVTVLYLLHLRKLNFRGSFKRVRWSAVCYISHLKDWIKRVKTIYTYGCSRADMSRM